MTETDRKQVLQSYNRYKRIIGSAEFKRDLESVMTLNPAKAKHPKELLKSATTVLRVLYTDPCTGMVGSPPKGFWQTPLGQHLRQIRIRCGSPSDMLSVADVAELVGMTPMRIYQLVDEKVLKPVKTSSTRKFRRRDIVKWMKGLS